MDAIFAPPATRAAQNADYKRPVNIMNQLPKKLQLPKLQPQQLLLSKLLLKKLLLKKLLQKTEKKLQQKKDNTGVSFLPAKKQVALSNTFFYGITSPAFLPSPAF
jgi:hypothetical protein